MIILVSISNDQTLSNAVRMLLSLSLVLALTPCTKPPKRARRMHDIVVLGLSMESVACEGGSPSEGEDGLEQRAGEALLLRGCDGSE